MALEAFKADQARLDRGEFSAKQWATAYDFPAVREKRVRQGRIPDQRVRAGCRASSLNLRRDHVQRCHGCAGPSITPIDFEEMNKQLFYRPVQAHQQLFRWHRTVPRRACRRAGTADSRDGARQGAGRGLHDALRQSGRRQSGGGARQSARERAAAEGSRLRGARPQAGRCRRQAGQRRNSWCRIRAASAIVAVLQAVAGTASASRRSIRIVDDAQYQNRLRSFDFDIITDVWGQSLSPGNEQREFWGSQAADRPGSRNIIGIKNPAVDALIERVIFAKDRADLVAATKALDRVLLWNFYVVPQFTYGFSRYARWDRFSHAEPLPKYGRSGLPSLWWYDAEKAARIGKRSLEGDIAHGASHPPARARSRRRRAERGAVSAGDRGRSGGAEAHGMSVFGDLKYPADFHHFDYVNPNAPKGGMFSTIPSVRAYNQSYPDLQLAQRLHPEGRGRAGHGPDVRDADGARRRRAGRDVRPGREVGADFARQADLSLHAAARGAISRRLEADRA